MPTRTLTKRSGRTLETTEAITASELSERLAEPSIGVVDVRSDAEWDGGHIPGALHIPLGQLEAGADLDLRDFETVVVHCQTGERSAIAASLLQAKGFPDVLVFSGGYAAWTAANLPTTAGAPKL